MKKWSFSVVVALCAAAVSVGAVPVLPVPTVGAAALPVGSSVYAPVSPGRLADTRTSEGSFGFTRVNPEIIRVKVAGRMGVPANATAAALNIVSVNSANKGFATVYPAGTDIPPTSTLNIDQPWRTIANMTTVQLGADGSVDIFANTPDGPGRRCRRRVHARLGAGCRRSSGHSGRRSAPCARHPRDRGSRAVARHHVRLDRRPRCAHRRHRGRRQHHRDRCVGRLLDSVPAGRATARRPAT